MKDRWSGLDIYRIIAMVMITALHVNHQHLGLLDRSRPMAIFYIGYLVEYACFAGVNCFAMLSGFIMGRSNPAYDGKWLKKFFLFWLKIVTWAVVLYLGVFCYSKGTSGFSLEQLELILVPLDPGWWYICAYMGLLVVLPVISKGLNSCSRRELLILAIMLFAVFSVLPMICESEGAWALEYGYSTIWLAVCFIFGATIREFYDDLIRFKWLNAVAVVIVSGCVLLPCCLHLFLPDERRFMNYTSPFCLLEAAGLLVLCARIKLKRNRVIKWVSFVSINSLGIYLFQTYCYVWQNCIVREFPPGYSLAGTLWRLLTTVVLLCAAGVFCNLVVDRIFRLLPWDGWLDKWCKR